MSTLARLTAALADRYELVRELGAGGMATVYLARDVRHAREVAIKVLHPELAAVLGAERFLSEIRTTASLQHPHILPLFDSGEAAGQLFYVMPFVDGETLRTRLERETQLPIADALRIAREVADALQYAHERGVIHRDIKPENILLQGGHALVADFGIALAVTNAGGTRMTQTGLSLGTPQYMAPEQAMGERTIDARADVYALGAVTYEMLAGEPPFSGATSQAIVARVLTERPRELGVVRDTVPAAVNAAVMTAMARLPADRHATARAFAMALVTAGGARADTGTGSATAAPGSRARRYLLGGGVAIASATAGVVGALTWQRPVLTPSAPLTRVELVDGGGRVFRRASDQVARGFAISPNGTTLVFTAPDGDTTNAPLILWRRDLTALVATPLRGTDGASGVRFSPDSRRISFRRKREIVVMDLDGSNVVTLPVAARNAPWGTDGQVYLHLRGALFRWRPGAMAPESLPVPAAGVVEITDLLPGERGVIGVDVGSGRVVCLLFASKARVVIAAGSGPRISTDGQLLFYRNLAQRLLAQPFDPARCTTTGDAVDTGEWLPTGGSDLYDLAADGTLVSTLDNVVPGEVSPARAPNATRGAVVRRGLSWVSRSGVETPIAALEGEMLESMALAPDGVRLVVTIGESATAAPRDLWLVNLQTGTRVPLTRDGRSSRPAWYPRADSILFVHQDEQGTTLRRMAVNGSDAGSVLVPLNGAPANGYWTPDGRELVLRMPGQTLRSIWRQRPGVDRKPIPVLDRGFNETNPTVSPDGRWLAYTSSVSGRAEVYVQPWTGRGAVQSVSTGGGASPEWSRDGRELFFVGADRTMRAVRVTTDSTGLRLGPTTTLFPLGALSADPFSGGYGVTTDGRFLFRLGPTAPVGSGLTHRLQLVRGWLPWVQRTRLAPPGGSATERGQRERDGAIQ